MAKCGAKSPYCIGGAMGMAPTVECWTASSVLNRPKSGSERIHRHGVGIGTKDIAKVEADLGPVDILVNKAGITGVVLSRRLRFTSTFSAR